jgi:hypothetical protein
MNIEHSAALRIEPDIRSAGSELVNNGLLFH